LAQGRPPTQEQLEAAAKEVSGLNYKSEFVHGPNYMVKLVESFSIGKSSDYVDPFIDQIVAMSDLPKFVLLGGAEVTAKAGAEELTKFIKPLLKPSKDKLKLFFEEQILKPLMVANNIDTCPQLIINDIPLLKEEIEAEIEAETPAKDTDTDTDTDKDTDKNTGNLNKSKLAEKKKKISRAYGLNLEDINGKDIITGGTKQLAFSIK